MYQGQTPLGACSTVSEFPTLLLRVKELLSTMVFNFRCYAFDFGASPFNLGMKQYAIAFSYDFHILKYGRSW
jgi:hypothetical protein